MIRTGEDDTFIIPVDKKLKPVEADYHYYSGDTAQLLRSIDSIKEEMAFQISWDESEATDVSSARTLTCSTSSSVARTSSMRRVTPYPFTQTPLCSNWC
mgnify:CR=1 FL=1